MTAASPTRSTRGRRTVRPSGDEREQAILSTAERLLDERAFSDISVDDLAKGAGLSRPTFYFYFGSKDAVLLTLFERILVAADSTMAGNAISVSDDPAQVWRAGIYAFFEAFRAHRGVALAGLAARGTNPELRSLWSRFMQKWIDQVAELITAERDRGAAPDTIPAHDLSTALNLMNERVVFASGSAEQPAIATEEAALDTLAHIWVKSIYGGTP